MNRRETSARELADDDDNTKEQDKMLPVEYLEFCQPIIEEVEKLCDSNDVNKDYKLKVIIIKSLEETKGSLLEVIDLIGRLNTSISIAPNRMMNELLSKLVTSDIWDQTAVNIGEILENQAVLFDNVAEQLKVHQEVRAKVSEALEARGIENVPPPLLRNRHMRDPAMRP